jgi:hypothetical protein
MVAVADSARLRWDLTVIVTATAIVSARGSGSANARGRLCTLATDSGRG